MKVVALTGVDPCAARTPSLQGDGDTVGGRFVNVARRYAERPAIVAGDRSYQYGAISVAAQQVAAYLQRQPGFGVGARVALVAPNGPEYLAAFYGASLAGGVVVPLPERIDAPLLRQVLADAGAAWTLTDGRGADRLGAALAAATEELNVGGPAPADVAPAVPTGGLTNRPALLLYTSGSTGRPKGVLLSHGNLLSNAESILGYLPIRPGDRALALLPFCHAYGNSVLQTHALCGATLVVAGSATFPNTIVDALDQYEVNSMAGVPELYAGLLRCSDLGVRKLRHLRYMTVAGAAMPPSAALEVAARIAPAEFFVMYGQTEATARLAYLPASELRRRPASIGRAIPGVELQIRDEAGVIVGVGETGELCARGGNIMLGYWRDEAATDAVLKEGWLHTGDLARVDEDGFIYVVGRSRDQVKIRGLKVSPQAIAEALSRRLRDCQIAVAPFQWRGSARLALFAASSRRGPQLLHEIQRACAESLQRHERPAYIEMMERLPLTASLKIDRYALACRAEQRLSELEAQGEPAAFTEEAA